MKEYYEFKRVYNGEEIVIRTPHVDGNIYDLVEVIESFLLACRFHSDSIASVLEPSELER